MAKATMDLIRRSEEKADNTVREARKEAERMIEAAKAEAAKRKKEAGKAAAELVEGAKAEALAAAETGQCKKEVRYQRNGRQTAERSSKNGDQGAELISRNSSAKKVMRVWQYCRHRRFISVR